MKNKKLFLRAVLSGTAVIITFANSYAADKTWNGGAANGLWSNSANWGGTAPVGGDTLVFDGGVRLTNTNNLAAGTIINGVNFASGAGAFSISQVANSNIVLNGNITNASANLQTFSLITLTNTQSAIEINTGTAGIRFTNTGTKIYSAYTITKTGSGTLFMHSDLNNAFSNNMIVNEGTLINTGTGTAPFGMEYTVMASGTAVGASAAGILTGSKGVKIANGANVTFMSLTAGVTNTMSAAWFGDASYGQGVTVVKSGVGILRINGGATNANFGNTTGNVWQIDQGTLYSSGGDANLGAANNRIVLNGGTFQSSGMTLGSSRTITLSNNSGNTIRPDDGSTLTISNANQLTGVGGFTKVGAGTLTINAAQNYQGKTTIAAGAIKLSTNGAFASSSEINLGTFGSQGSIVLTNKVSFAFGTNQIVSGFGAINIGAGKTVTVSGTLSPGNSAGIITNTGNLTLDSAASIVMELAGSGGLAGTDFDQLQVSGLLTYGGALSITSYNGYDLTTATNYTLFTAGSRSGTFSSVNVAGFGALTFDSIDTYTGTGGGITYTFTLSDGKFDVVPEPSTLALLGLTGIAAIGYRLRRRNR